VPRGGRGQAQEGKHRGPDKGCSPCADGHACRNGQRVRRRCRQQRAADAEREEAAEELQGDAGNDRWLDGDEPAHTAVLQEALDAFLNEEDQRRYGGKLPRGQWSCPGVNVGRDRPPHDERAGQA